MRSFISIIILILISGAVAIASQSVHINLPIVFGAPYSTTTVCNASAPILDQDTGSISAVLTTDGKFIIAYQDRAHGSIIRVAEHVGSGLVDIPGPVMTSISSLVEPQFSPPGPKQGPMSLVAMSGGKNRMYYTQRKLDDATGPYGIWCLEF